jgi:hypothetical protein
MDYTTLCMYQSQNLLFSITLFSSYSAYLQFNAIFSHLVSLILFTSLHCSNFSNHIYQPYILMYFSFFFLIMYAQIMLLKILYFCCFYSSTVFITPCLTTIFYHWLNLYLYNLKYIFWTLFCQVVLFAHILWFWVLLDNFSLLFIVFGPLLW